MTVGIFTSEFSPICNNCGHNFETKNDSIKGEKKGVELNLELVVLEFLLGGFVARPCDRFIEFVKVGVYLSE